VGDDGAEVTIAQETHHPFEEPVRLKFSPAEPVSVPLYLRVPGWSAAPVVEVNGEVVKATERRGDAPTEGASGEAASAGGPYLVSEHEWRDGDTVELTLPMTIEVRRWEENHDSVSVDRGPLTYSLKIEEQYKLAGGTEKWPAHEILPGSPWNYALVLGNFQA